MGLRSDFRNASEDDQQKMLLGGCMIIFVGLFVIAFIAIIIKLWRWALV